jgi:hypothetical protein
MAAGTVTGTVLYQPYLMVNSKDLSTYVTEIAFSNEVKEELSGAGAATRTGVSRFGGEKDHILTVTLNQSFVAAEVDATLRGIIGTAVPIVVGQTGATASATNTVYSFYGMFFSYDPFGGGSVGRPQRVKLEIKLADGVPATPTNA